MSSPVVVTLCQYVQSEATANLDDGVDRIGEREVVNVIDQ
jgi:hypothetical protein